MVHGLPGEAPHDYALMAKASISSSVGVETHQVVVAGTVETEDQQTPARHRPGRGTVRAGCWIGNSFPVASEGTVDGPVGQQPGEQDAVGSSALHLAGDGHSPGRIDEDALRCVSSPEIDQLDAVPGERAVERPRLSRHRGPPGEEQRGRQ